MRPNGESRLRQGERLLPGGSLPWVFGRVLTLATLKMAQELRRQMLHPTVLVPKAWFPLGGDAQPVPKNRACFLANTAIEMQRNLVRRTRQRTALERAGGATPIQVTEVSL